tara:strand:+ start:423 stop:1037 length:615 start_codon:yes stop_codon:yes gene_type:complete
MSYVPEFVALYEIIPYIRNFPLDNDTIRVAVKDYRKGGEKKAAIIKKYGKIGDWNTTNVTDMSRLFYDYINFNEDISKWDTSKVTNMNRMFYNAMDFNQPIGGWNTSKVTNMEDMFYESHKFNQPIGEWNTSKVTNMYHMFYRAKNFNQIIGDWDTSKVTNAWLMLVGATSFNVKNVSCSLLKIIIGINYESDSDIDDYDSDDE